jgi:hypothetical protein
MVTRSVPDTAKATPVDLSRTYDGDYSSDNREPISLW